MSFIFKTTQSGGVFSIIKGSKNENQLGQREESFNVSVNLSNTLILLAQIFITKIFDISISVAFIKNAQIIDGLFFSDARG